VQKQREEAERKREEAERQWAERQWAPRPLGHCSGWTQEWETGRGKGSETQSTAESTSEISVPKLRQLTEVEEWELRKCEKALREISKLEERLARSEKLEANQLRKIQRRAEIENSTVMLKVRIGYVVHSQP